jgi:hypothetical protein
MHLPGPPVQLGLQAPGPVLARRALLPLPLLLLTGLPLRTPAVDTFEFNGKAGLTELEVRAQMTKKLEAAALSGKGIDIEKRGQFNEKALFSEDFYFKFGLRPTPEDLKNKPVEDLPFAPIQRRYTGYKKYEERIKAGLDLYGGVLRTKVQEGAWADVGPLLEKGVKGKGNSKTGEGGTGVLPAELRSSCRAMGLFGNTVLQSENDSGTTSVNLLARHLINEFYFAMDDVAEAAAAGDKNAAKAAWTKGQGYANAYLDIVNRAITSKVGDKFPQIEGTV